MKTYINGEKEHPTEAQNISRDFIQEASKGRDRKFEDEIAVYERLAPGGQVGFLKLGERDAGSAGEEAQLANMTDQAVDDYGSVSLAFYPCQLSIATIARVVDDKLDEEADDEPEVIEDRLRTQGKHPRLGDYLFFTRPYTRSKIGKSNKLNTLETVEVVRKEAKAPSFIFKIYYKNRRAMRYCFPVPFDLTPRSLVPIKSVEGEEGIAHETDHDSDSSNLTSIADNERAMQVLLVPSSDEEEDEVVPNLCRTPKSRTATRPIEIEIPQVDTTPSSPRKRKRRIVSEDSGLDYSEPSAPFSPPLVPIASSSRLPETPFGRMTLQAEPDLAVEADEESEEEQLEDEIALPPDPFQIEVNLHFEGNWRGKRRLTAKQVCCVGLVVIHWNLHAKTDHHS